jgi:hypothetical protein
MAQIYTRKAPDRNQNPRQLPTNYDNDRYTPMPDDHFNEPIYNDQPIQSSYPTASEGRPEFYHLKAGENDPEPMRDDQPFKSSPPPPMNDTYSPSRADAAPELYHLKLDGDNQPIPEHRPPSGFSSNNRVSPMPYQNSNSTEQKTEMYHIKLGDEPDQQSLPIKKTTFNDQPIYLNNQDQNPDPDPDPDYQQRKATMYVLSAPNGENLPPPFSIQQRTPSPQIHTMKTKQKQQPAVSYDIMDDDYNNKKYDVPTKRRPFPTALNDVSTNIRYIPLSQSKASESIERSMNKYRFGGN